MSLTWSQTPEDRFSRDRAHLLWFCCLLQVTYIVLELEIDSGLCHCILTCLHCILTCLHYAVYMYMTNAIKIPVVYVIRLSRIQKQYSQVDDTDAGVMVSLDVVVVSVVVVVVSVVVVSVDVVDVDVDGSP